MSIAEIRQAILELPREEYDELVRWLNELEADEWEKLIERDSLEGRLDFLVEEAEEAKENGTLRDL